MLHCFELCDFDMGYFMKNTIRHQPSQCKKHREGLGFWVREYKEVRTAGLDKRMLHNLKENLTQKVDSLQNGSHTTYRSN